MKKISDETLIEDLRSVAAFFGEQSITLSEYLNHGEYSKKPFLDRWGTWNKAVEQAGLRVNKARGGNFGSVKTPVAVGDTPFTKGGIYGRKRIRGNQYLAILKRDCFKCAICGASPAINPKVELHIDHIIPVSKGGGNEVSNLWTLCSKCNYKKLDKIDVDVILYAREYFDSLSTRDNPPTSLQV